MQMKISGFTAVSTRIPTPTNIDVVFCIDGTGSMDAYLDGIKQIMKSWETDISAVCNECGRSCGQLRARLIVFRDYVDDGENAMQVTDFFNLPQQAEEFEACINSITASGGGDIPEDGLEALAYAIKSKWCNESTIKRHVIIVWTDAPTHDIGFGRNSKHYPNGMPQDMSELNDWWEEMNDRAKRLIMFAPDETHWDYISRQWENVAHFHAAAGDRETEEKYKKALLTIVHNV